MELEKGWRVESFVDLCEWCQPRLCETRDVLFGPGGFDRETDVKSFQAKRFDFQNEPIDLKTFDHIYTKDGQMKESFGGVLTSRHIFRNVRYAVEGQGRDGFSQQLTARIAYTMILPATCT